MSSNHPTLFNQLQAYQRKTRFSCPDCATNMTPFLCDQKWLVDKCNDCDGIWFEKGVIGQFKRVLDSFDLAQLDVLYAPIESNIITISGCPSCNLPLETFNYGYNLGVSLNRCPRCRGLWMPYSQLVNLLNRTKTGQILEKDIQGLLIEMKNYDSAIKKYKLINQLLSLLTHPIRFLWNLIKP